jgi:hypothetical protein
MVILGREVVIPFTNEKREGNREWEEDKASHLASGERRVSEDTKIGDPAPQDREDVRNQPLSPMSLHSKDQEIVRDGDEGY